jgi:hypothetical protein
MDVGPAFVAATRKKDMINKSERLALGTTLTSYWNDHLSLQLFFLVNAGVVAFLLTFLIIILNGGMIVYTLDDPYIHLALAEHLRHLHYGINTGEAAAPSSSILFPFLLATPLVADARSLTPLVINLAATAGTALVIGRIVADVADGLDPRRRTGVALLGSLIVVAAVPVAFTGLEHSLHILLTLLALVAMLRLGKTRRAPGWFPAVIVLMPLLRFEGLALAGASILLLLWYRQWRQACVAVLGLGVAFGLHLWLMHALGLPWLPSSVLVKSQLAQMAVDPAGSANLLHRLLLNLFNSLSKDRGFLLLALAIALWLPLARADSEEARTAAPAVVALTLTIGAHVVAGAYGWFDRYELYVVLLALMAAIHFSRVEIARCLRRHGQPMLVLLGSLLCLVLWPYLKNLAFTPIASHNHYLQHYQMHRFVVDYYKDAVAVNNLGWVSYGNDHYVLDLLGLGSEAARQARLGAGTSDWMAAMVDQRQVGLVMIYEDWFPILPASWTPVARLVLERPLITRVARGVSFYATRSADVASVRERLRQFQATLPAGARLELLPAAPVKAAVPPHAGATAIDEAPG